MAGDTIELTPPFIVSEDQIGEIIDKIGKIDQGGGVGGRLARRGTGLPAAPGAGHFREVVHRPLNHFGLFVQLTS